MNTTTQTASQTNEQIAQEILNQLGGKRFLAMTGAKNLAFDGPALTMHLTKNKAKAKYLRIELTDLDLYNVIFRKDGKDFTFPEVARYDGIEVCQLRDIYTDVTGHYLSL